MVPQPYAATGIGASKEASRAGSAWIAILFVFGYLFYLGAFIPALRFARGLDFYPGSSLDPVSTAVQAIVLAALGLVTLIHWKGILPGARAAWPYLLFTLLALASMAWSDFPDTTLRRVVALAGCMLLGHIGISIIGLKRVVALIGLATVIAAVASLLVFVLVPYVGRDLEIYGGTMRGVFAQKNVLAGAMLPGLASYLYLWQLKPGHAPLIRVALLLACIVLAGSVSALGIGSFLIALAILFKARGVGSQSGLLIYFAVSVAVIGLMLAVFFPEDLVRLVGRDLTLTGRVDLWAMAPHFFAERPLLGYGYAAFWNSASPNTAEVVYYLGWRPSDMHNGFLDIGLQLGLAGYVLIIPLLVATGYRAWRAVQTRAFPEAVWVAFVFIATMVVNVNEARLLDPNAFTLVLLCSWLALRQAAGRATGRTSTASYVSFGPNNASEAYAATSIRSGAP